MKKWILLLCMAPFGTAAAQIPVVQPQVAWVIDGATSTISVPGNLFWRVTVSG